MPKLTHLNSSGEARMVNVGDKPDTEREAVASSRVHMKPGTLEQIKAASLKKGDALAVARVAGIMAAKKTPELIPLCHPILTNEIAINFDLSAEDSVGITATVKCLGKTGAEMEAMVAASVAALTIYDMGKSVDRGMTITDVHLESKSGGKSGVYKRK
jgi:cyclic pyranopterin monophosphate synthase